MLTFPDLLISSSHSISSLINVHLFTTDSLWWTLFLPSLYDLAKQRLVCITSKRNITALFMRFTFSTLLPAALSFFFVKLPLTYRKLSSGVMLLNWTTYFVVISVSCGCVSCGMCVLYSKCVMLSSNKWLWSTQRFHHTCFVFWIEKSSFSIFNREMPRNVYFSSEPLLTRLLEQSFYSLLIHC